MNEEQKDGKPMSKKVCIDCVHYSKQNERCWHRNRLVVTPDSPSCPEFEMASQDAVNHPPHYSGYPAIVECIDITRHLSFNIGNAFKYCWRAGRKGAPEKAIEDLEKALRYLKWANEQPEPQNATAQAIFKLISWPPEEARRKQALEEILYDGTYVCCVAQLRINEWIAELKRKTL